MSGPSTPTNQSLPGFPNLAATPAKPAPTTFHRPFLTPQPTRPQGGLYYAGKFGGGGNNNGHHQTNAANRGGRVVQQQETQIPIPNKSRNDESDDEVVVGMTAAVHEQQGRNANEGVRSLFGKSNKNSGGGNTFRQVNQSFSNVSLSGGGGGLGFGAQTPMPSVESSAAYRSMFTRGQPNHQEAASAFQRQSGGGGNFRSLIPWSGISQASAPPQRGWSGEKQQHSHRGGGGSPLMELAAEQLNQHGGGSPTRDNLLSPTTPTTLMSTPPPGTKPPETPVKSTRVTRVPSFNTPHLGAGNGCAIKGGNRPAAWISPIPQSGPMSDLPNNCSIECDPTQSYNCALTPQHSQSARDIHHQEQTPSVQQYANRNPFSPYMGSRLVSTRAEAHEPLSTHASIVVVEHSLPDAVASAAPSCSTTPALRPLHSPTQHVFGMFGGPPGPSGSVVSLPSPQELPCPQEDSSFDASPASPASPQHRQFDRTATAIYHNPHQNNHMNSSGLGSSGNPPPTGILVPLSTGRGGVSPPRRTSAFGIFADSPSSPDDVLSPPHNNNCGGSPQRQGGGGGGGLRYYTPTKSLNMTEMQEGLGATVDSSADDSSAEAPPHRRGLRRRSSSVTWTNAAEGRASRNHQHQQGSSGLLLLSRSGELPVSSHNPHHQAPYQQQQGVLFEQPSLEPRFAFHHRVPIPGGALHESQTEAVALAQDVNGTVWLGTSMVDGMPYSVKQVLDSSLVNPVELAALHLGSQTPHIARLHTVFTHTLPPLTSPNNGGGGGIGQVILSSCRGENGGGVLGGVATINDDNQNDESTAGSSSGGGGGDSIQVIQTEYFSRGCLLESLLKRSCPPSEAMVRKIMQQVLLGLETLHSRGIAHGNLTLLNIFIDNDGTYKIGNMGAAIQVSGPSTTREEGATRKISVLPELYEPQNKAAEQDGSHGQVSEETPFTRDVYSFAVSFVHVLWISLLKAYGTTAQLADSQQRNTFTVDSLAFTIPPSSPASAPRPQKQHGGHCYSSEMLCAFRSLTHQDPRQRLTATQALAALHPVPSTLLHHIFCAYEKEIVLKKNLIRELEKQQNQQQEEDTAAAATAAVTHNNNSIGVATSLLRSNTGSSNNMNVMSTSSLTSPPKMRSTPDPATGGGGGGGGGGISLFGSFMQPKSNDGTPRPGNHHRRSTSSNGLFGAGPSSSRHITGGHHRTPTLTSVFDDSMDSLTPRDAERKMAFIAETVQATRPTAFGGGGSSGGGSSPGGKRWKGVTSPFSQESDPIVEICRGGRSSSSSNNNTSRGQQQQQEEDAHRLDPVVELSLQQLAEKIAYVPLSNAPVVV